MEDIEIVEGKYSILLKETIMFWLAKEIKNNEEHPEQSQEVLIAYKKLLEDKKITYVPLKETETFELLRSFSNEELEYLINLPSVNPRKKIIKVYKKENDGKK